MTARGRCGLTWPISPQTTTFTFRNLTLSAMPVYQPFREPTPSTATEANPSKVAAVCALDLSRAYIYDRAMENVNAKHHLRAPKAMRSLPLARIGMTGEATYGTYC